MYTSQEMSNLRRFLARFLRDGDADEAVEGKRKIIRRIVLP